MKVELLVSEWCPTCPQAEQVWRQVADERDIEFAVLDMMQTEGRALVQRLRIRTIPAVVIDGVLQGVGVQSLSEAHRLVAAAPLRKRASPRHAGLLLSADNRLFIVTAMVYLIASGTWLLAHGMLLTGSTLRPVGIHLFGAGFVLSLIYGLGAHMLPRFTGNPIRVGAWPRAQYMCLNLGIMLFAGGHWLLARWAMIAGGALMWLSLLIYALRAWPVLWRQDVETNCGNGAAAS
ncbi:MAG: glutaredoxin family protein [Burkholderiales bacterium]